MVFPSKDQFSEFRPRENVVSSVSSVGVKTRFLRRIEHEKVYWRSVACRDAFDWLARP
jgi:hypothetical protein